MRAIPEYFHSYILLSTATVGVDVDLLQSIFEINNSTVHEVKPLITGVFKWTVVFQPLPAVWLQYGAKNGGNSLGTTSDTGNAIGKSFMLFNQRCDSFSNIY